jgi:NAD(P) transhydrogenase subunit alpha
MKIAVLKETQPFETRVAATPETVKKLIQMGATVLVEEGAGIAAAQENNAYQDAGAQIISPREALLKEADIILCVQGLLPKAGDPSLKNLKPGAIVIGILSPYTNRESLELYAQAQATCLAMELVPRITRAQTMDVLSSQSNLAGYRAVLEASFEFKKAFPMMMTAAGTIAPARVLILGAGVAGLQAIATARRLGAIVSAFDVRAAAREQVESLGALFVSVEAEENLETAGGYAKETSEGYKQSQGEKIHECLKKSDIAITTALIPGKPAPLLITKDMVASMRSGSVIVDMAVESGGNCELTEMGKVSLQPNGVKIVGYPNLPSRIATDASALYSRNLLSFLSLIIDPAEKKIKIQWEDDIIKATALTQAGKLIHPLFGKE